MASFLYTRAKYLMATGALDLATADLRALLVMEGTTADTNEDAANLAAISILAECDGANYARQALANTAVAEDQDANAAVLSCDDIPFATLGAGTNPNVGLLIFVHTGSAATDIPVAYHDGGGFPFVGQGLTVVLKVGALGVARID